VTMSGTHAYVAGEVCRTSTFSDPCNPQFLGISDPDNEYADCYGLTVSKASFTWPSPEPGSHPLGAVLRCLQLVTRRFRSSGSIDDPYGTYNYDVAISGSHAYLADEAMLCG